MGFEKYLTRDVYAKAYRFLTPRVTGLLVLGVITGLLTSGVELALAAVLQLFLIKLGITLGDVNLPHWMLALDLNQTLLLLMAIGLVRGLLTWLQSYDRGAALRYFHFAQRSRLVEWAFSSPTTSSSKFMTMFDSFTTSGGVFVMMLQFNVTRLTTCVVLAVALLKMSLAPTLLAMLAVMVLGVGLRLITRRVKKMSESVTKKWQKTVAHLLDSIRNLILLEIYGMSQHERRAAEDGLKSQLGEFLGYHRLEGLYRGISQFASVVLLCFVALMLHSREYGNSGMLISYFYLFMRFSQSISELAANTTNLMLNRPQIVRLAQWWSKEAHDGVWNRREAALPAKTAKRFEGPVGWDIKNVSFKYSPESSEIFKGLNLRIGKGEVVAFMGPSGSGKSTLLSLLIGLSKPTTGDVNVLADEIENLSQCKQDFLANLGYVGPESFVVAGTVYENLTYGLLTSPSASAVDAALEMAECQFLKALPHGLETKLTEQGQGLSAGQKQRISLARALLRQPKALILDEATANLDNDTERRLIATFAKLKGNMTIVVAAHREAILEIADHIYELKTDTIDQTVRLQRR